MAATSVCTHMASSLLFQFEAIPGGVDHGGHGLSSSLAGSSAADRNSTSKVIERIKYFTKPSCPFSVKLLRDVQDQVHGLLKEAESVDMVELASKLHAIGYTVIVRSACGGGDCFVNLRHEFLVCAGSGDYEGVEYVVDMHFREQFEIPQPSARYSEVLASLPALLVAPVSKVVLAVQQVCPEMAASFTERGMTLPPWRKQGAVLTKWMPAKKRDQTFSSPSSPRAQGGPEASRALSNASSGGSVLPSSEVPSPTASRVNSKSDLFVRTSVGFEV